MIDNVNYSHPAYIPQAVCCKVTVRDVCRFLLSSSQEYAKVQWLHL